MDFAALPPEINSGLMYTGPGSAPMMAAAAAWDNLAVEMYSATSDYGSVIANLTNGPWRGTASASMAGAAAPYVSWMSSTAAQAEQAAGQAKAAASAYESAFAATVPPPVIVANRSLLASLISTNILGQNTPAIAATEAHYGEMWAQDAAAMYGYAGSSSAASTLTPFAEPPATTTATGTAAQAATTVAQATGTGTQSHAVATDDCHARCTARTRLARVVDVVRFGVGVHEPPQLPDRERVRNGAFGSVQRPVQLEWLGLERQHLEHHLLVRVLHAGKLDRDPVGDPRAPRGSDCCRCGGGCGRGSGCGQRLGWCTGGPGRRNRRAKRPGQRWRRGVRGPGPGCGDRSAGRAAELGCGRPDGEPCCPVVGERPASARPGRRYPACPECRLPMPPDTPSTATLPSTGSARR